MKRSNRILKSRLVKPSALVSLGKRLRDGKKKVVFTAGSFDLLHIGHMRYLRKAKTFGDVLVVGLPGNRALRKLKGRGRPIIDEKARAEALLYLEPVDYVVIFPERTVAKILRRLKPAVFFTVSEAWNRGFKASPEYKIVKSFGGRVVLSPRQSPFISASAIINKIAGQKVKEVFRECLEMAASTEIFSEDLEKVQLKFDV